MKSNLQHEKLACEGVPGAIVIARKPHARQLALVLRQARQQKPERDCSQLGDAVRQHSGDYSAVHFVCYVTYFSTIADSLLGDKIEKTTTQRVLLFVFFCLKNIHLSEKSLSVNFKQGRPVGEYSGWLYTRHARFVYGTARSGH